MTTVDARFVGGIRTPSVIAVPTGERDAEGIDGIITVALPQNFDIPSQSGIYSGSLSSLGNMVAMQLNNSDTYLFYDSISGADANPKAPNFGFSVRQIINIKVKPYLLGYFRQYWRDPAKATFGANTAIPALTGVMPDTEEFSDTQGSFVFYVDLQMSRLLGQSGSFDFNYFSSAFGQLISWVDISNRYLLQMKQIEKRNLEYYGFQNYSQYVTQDLIKYQTGQALRLCFNKIGKMTEIIGEGHFGSPGAVAKVLVNNNLGYIGDLSQKLSEAGVVFEDIYNEDYKLFISNILISISDPAELRVVQDTIGSECAFFRNLYDYTSLEAVSGLENDSSFKTLEEVGKDLYLKFPGVSFENGAVLTKLINDIEGMSGDSVENIGGAKTLLNKDIIDSFKKYLPLSDDNDPITLMNIIGTPSGYLNDYMKYVTEGIDELSKTKYGSQLRNILMEISRTGAGIPLSIQEQITADTYIPVPAPEWSYDDYGNRTAVDKTGGPGYWELLCNQNKQAYLNLLNTITADTTENIPAIINKINSNYLEACRLLRREIKNYAKAAITVTPYPSNSEVFNFVENLTGFGVDSGNIGTSYMLYNMAQDNEAGNLLKTILIQARNNQSLTDAGVRLNGPE